MNTWGVIYKMIYDENCNLCPRMCNVSREKGNLGFCGCGNNVVLSRAALHNWEEPCISGKNGSGTVFFSGCSLRCVFCQNFEISNCKCGKIIDDKRLAEIFLELQEQNANNINLVTPTHFVKNIIRALDYAKNNGLKIPVVYNSSGYERAETIDMLEGYVDIYLPDFKYMNPELSKKYSHAEDYPEYAKIALEKMVSQVGIPTFDRNTKLMKKGVIVRHLILPNQIEDSKQILKYLHEKYQNKIYISIMNQFTPLENVKHIPELNRKITKEEYENVIEYAENIGIKKAFIQEEGTVSESFIPKFDGTGV